MSLAITARHAILHAVEPVLPAMGKVQVPEWIAPRLMGKADAYSFMATDPAAGTVLLSRKRLQLTNAVIPGTWKHVAMYVGTFCGVPLIIEAVWPCVRVVPVQRWFEHEDYAMALVPTFASQTFMACAAARSISLLGMPYDRMIEFAEDLSANKAFYCAEIPAWCYDEEYDVAGETCPFKLREVMGMATVTADDYSKATDLWKQTWHSQTAIAAKLVA